MQRGNQIVKTVAFVIKTRAALAGYFREQLRLKYALTRVIKLGHIGHHFQGIERPTRITIHQFGNRAAGFIRQDDILTAVARALSSIA